MRILIVEDDEMLANGLTVGLRLQGLAPETVGSLADARHALAVGSFDAIVLDRMLPDGDGAGLLAELRRRGSAMPVLLLTARDGLEDRIEGLDGGADDYIGKPFELEELAARLRAILRRAEGRATGELCWNGFTLRPGNMSARRGDEVVSFSRHEFAILHALMERPGAILAKPTLEERLYGWQEEVASNTVEVHVHMLRRKLGPGFIETVRGVGYRLAGKPG